MTWFGAAAVDTLDEAVEAGGLMSCCWPFTVRLFRRSFSNISIVSTPFSMTLEMKDNQSAYSLKNMIVDAVVDAQLVGRAVASDSRGPRFEFSHWQNLYWLFTVNFIEKTKIKEKSGWEWPIKNIIVVVNNQCDQSWQNFTPLWPF